MLECAGIVAHGAACVFLAWLWGFGTVLTCILSGFILLVGMLTLTLVVLAAVSSSGTVVDSRARSVTQWGRFMGSESRESCSFDEFSAVRVRSRAFGKQGIRRIVELVRREGDPVQVLDDPDAGAARTAARRLAGCTRLSLFDETVEPPHLVRADRVGETLRQKLAGTGEELAPSALPVLPAGSRITARASARTLTLIARPRPSVWYLVCRLVAAALVAGSLTSLLWLFFGSGQIQSAERAGIAVFLAVPLSCGILVWLHIRQLATRGWSVAVSPRELVVEPLGFLGGKETRMPADRVESAAIVREAAARDENDAAVRSRSRHELLISWDQGEARLGEGLSGSELAWLRTVISRALGAGSEAR